MKFVGFWRRFAAYAIDIIPITLVLFLLFYFFLGFDAALRAYFDNRAAFLEQRNQIRDLAFIIWILYCAFAESSSLQGTLGKKLLGIKVVDREGQRLGFGRAIARNLAKIISFIPLGLGFLWVAFSKEKKGWHDMIAKTYVAHDSAEVENPMRHNTASR
jgi:uncharacterized RDD family membrane protein YckC